MANWLLNLRLSWMALIVFVTTYFIAGGVYLVVTKLALTEWAQAFKAVSPGMLPPLRSFCAVGWFHRGRAGIIWIKQRPPLRPRPARFALSFYSPELSLKNRRPVFTL